jgi:hypothetical protein
LQNYASLIITSRYQFSILASFYSDEFISLHLTSSFCRFLSSFRAGPRVSQPSLPRLLELHSFVETEQNNQHL